MGCIKTDSGPTWSTGYTLSTPALNWYACANPWRGKWNVRTQGWGLGSQRRYISVSWLMNQKWPGQRWWVCYLKECFIWIVVCTSQRIQPGYNCTILWCMSNSSFGFLPPHSPGFPLPPGCSLQLPLLIPVCSAFWCWVAQQSVLAPLHLHSLPSWFYPVLWGYASSRF